MDRRQKSMGVLATFAVTVMGVSSCGTVPDEQISQMFDRLEPADTEEAFGIPVAHPIILPDLAAAEAEPSFSSLLPDIFLADTRDPALPKSIKGELHLSATNGHLLLPVPRISDDLAYRSPPNPSVKIAGYTLSVPVLPRITTAHAPTSSLIDEGSQGRQLVEDSAATTPAGLIVSRLPASDTAALQISGPTQRLFPGATPHVPQTEVYGSEIAELSATRTDSPADFLLVENDIIGLLDAESDIMAGSSPPQTRWSQRSATVDSGSQVVITLPSSDWLYVGREYGVGVGDLKAKRSVAGDDEFVFEFSESGDYGLWFQRQDRSTGDITNERLQVDASPGGDRVVVVSLAETTPEVFDQVGSGDMAEVGDALSDEARRASPGEVAVPMDRIGTMPATVPLDDPAQWMATATAAARSGNVPLAADFWQRVSAGGGPDARLARESLFDLAVSRGDGSQGLTASDTALLAASVDALRDADELDHGRLLTAARVADLPGSRYLAREYYQELSEMGPPMTALDAVFFRLAEILEMPGPERDLRRALTLYEMVIKSYPLSMYWEESAVKIEYLNRHYFQIR